MNTTTASIERHRASTAASIVAWDPLEETVDRLADIIDARLASHDDQLVCSMQYPEAEALAEVLDAGRHTRTAARLMHRWALTEPDWETDRAHEAVVRGWLDIDNHPHLTGLEP
ncbi:hypothetical protein [Microbacterium yannicii]|uniref:hypothetical protein n=1 Tax=Microbacterium yannicii TaxID=671622 RepID=UPI0003056FE9|nr:hypothetical protein [Microbacterium yannicii]